MNSLTVSGKLIKDPESRTVQSGDLVVTFTVGEYAGKNQDGSYKPAPLWNCQVWGKRGEIIRDRCAKGTQLTISGRVKKDVWTDQSGAPRESLKVDVQDFDICFGQQTAPPEGISDASAEDDLPF